MTIFVSSLLVIIGCIASIAFVVTGFHYERLGTYLNALGAKKEKVAKMLRLVKICYNLMKLSLIILALGVLGFIYNALASLYEMLF